MGWSAVLAMLGLGVPWHGRAPCVEAEAIDAGGRRRTMEPCEEAEAIVAGCRGPGREPCEEAEAINAGWWGRPGSACNAAGAGATGVDGSGVGESREVAIGALA